MGTASPGPCDRIKVLPPAQGISTLCPIGQDMFTRNSPGIRTSTGYAMSMPNARGRRAERQKGRKGGIRSPLGSVGTTYG